MLENLHKEREKDMYQEKLKMQRLVSSKSSSNFKMNKESNKKLIDDKIACESKSNLNIYGNISLKNPDVKVNNSIKDYSNNNKIKYENNSNNNSENSINKNI